MTAHTPTPWDFVDAGRRIIARVPRHEITIANVRDARISPDERAANAAHIVRCVNAHDDLLAVVQDLVTYGGGMEYDDYRMLVQRGEAAIAKATQQ